MPTTCPGGRRCRGSSCPPSRRTCALTPGTRTAGQRPGRAARTCRCRSDGGRRADQQPDAGMDQLARLHSSRSATRCRQPGSPTRSMSACRRVQVPPIALSWSRRCVLRSPAVGTDGATQVLGCSIPGETCLSVVQPGRQAEDAVGGVPENPHRAAGLFPRRAAEGERPGRRRLLLGPALDDEVESVRPGACEGQSVTWIRSPTSRPRNPLDEGLAGRSAGRWSGRGSAATARRTARPSTVPGPAPRPAWPRAGRRSRSISSCSRIESSLRASCSAPVTAL